MSSELETTYGLKVSECVFEGHTKVNYAFWLWFAGLGRPILEPILDTAVVGRQTQITLFKQSRAVSTAQERVGIMADASKSTVRRRRQKSVSKPSLLSGDGNFVVLGGQCDLFRHVDPDAYMWVGDGDRSVIMPIKFERRLETNPLVFLSLQSIDASQGHNLRFDLSAENVTTRGFDVVFSTWFDTKIASCSISWFAFSQTAASALNHLLGKP